MHISKSNGPRIDSCGASQEISSIYLMSLVFPIYCFLWERVLYLKTKLIFMKEILIHEIFIQTIVYNAFKQFG